MARVISVDYGAKRTGLAVTDPLQLIAGGLSTVPSAQALSFIKQYVAREPVERIIVGKPTQNNGTDSENMPRVKSFVARLCKALPHIPVELYDERFTSLLARRAMLESGIKKKERQNKALVDEVSAVIILQDWMEAQQLKKGKTL